MRLQKPPPRAQCPQFGLGHADHLHLPGAEVALHARAVVAAAVTKNPCFRIRCSGGGTRAPPVGSERDLLQGRVARPESARAAAVPRVGVGHRQNSDVARVLCERRGGGARARAPSRASARRRGRSGALGGGADGRASGGAGGGRGARAAAREQRHRLSRRVRGSVGPPLPGAPPPGRRTAEPGLLRYRRGGGARRCACHRPERAARSHRRAKAGAADIR